jgi:lipopolysaccharide exporter
MSIKERALKSGKWVTLSTVFQTVVQFAQIAVLARVLSPAEFGIVSMSAIFISFFGLFADLGFSNSIIHKQESNQKVLSTIYFLNILLGLVMFTLAYLLSPLVVNFYNEPRLARVIHLAALIFLFSYYGSVHAIMLRKELKFKAIAIIDSCGYALGFIVTLTLAFNDFAELSLVYGTIAAQVVRTILEIVFGRSLFIPTFHFNLGEIKEHLRFGVFNLGEAFLNFVQSNWDNIIIGRILGAKYLGVYTLALQLGYYPVSKLNPLILQVAYPMIAKMKDNAIEFRRTYIRILDLLSYFNYPLLAGLYITVESVVPLVYGPGWEETYPLIKIFVFVSAVSCIAHPLFTIAYSKGKPKYLFYLSLLGLFVKIPLVFILGKYWNVTGVAFAILITALINMAINLLLVHSLIGSFVEAFARNLIKTVIFCLLMIFVVYLYKLMVGYEGWLNALLMITLGAFVFFLLTLKFKYSLSEIKDIRNSI